ncbi:MAG: aldehyde dehydrogenase family protein [Caldithrix sp.]|nr:aldehyde dehydrogenase family protein [Caldithrix sp.]
MNETMTEMRNPVTDELLGQTPLHTKEHLIEKVGKARQAQSEWQKIRPAKRASVIRKIRSYIVDHGDELAENIRDDNGKLLIDAMATEVIPAAMAVDYYCKQAAKFLKDKRIRGSSILFINKSSKTVRVPYGVVGIISPWNYPFAIPFSEVIMALLAGNGVILKTATETQSVGWALKKAIDSCGLPPNLFSMVNMKGRVAGDAFLDSGIDKLFFTGSVPVGKYLMGKASASLTPVCLELGGNDPMIICEDADLRRAAGGAVWAGLSNAGQSCGGVERIYVHENVYDEFMAILKENVENLRVGYEKGYFDSDMGAMTTEKQVQSVKKQVDDAVNQGAVVYTQSAAPQHAHYLPATVLTEVNHQMTVMREETFGPVLAVMKYHSVEEAINLANDSDLGLTASVWCGNIKKAEAIGRQIRAGTITINDHLMSHGLPETAWGGFKQSGIGRTHGKLGFDEMTQPQMIVKERFSFIRKNLWWPPYNRMVYDGLRGILYALYSRNLLKRLQGLRSLMKTALRMFRY